MRVAITEQDLNDLAPDSVVLITTGATFGKREDGNWQRPGGLWIHPSQLANGRPMIVIFNAGQAERLVASIEVLALQNLECTDGQELASLAEIDFVNCWRRHHPIREDSETARWAETTIRHPSEFSHLDGDFTGG